jgi:hypothetical protein
MDRFTIILKRLRQEYRQLELDLKDEVEAHVLQKRKVHRG